MIDVARRIASPATIDRVAVGHGEKVRDLVIPVFGEELFGCEPPAVIGADQRPGWQIGGDEGAKTMDAAWCDLKLGSGRGHEPMLSGAREASGIPIATQAREAPVAQRLNLNDRFSCTSGSV